MYNDLINQQFMIDFNCEKHSLNNNLYQTNKPYKTARYFARQTANIVVYNNHLYIRTSKKELTQQLQQLFQNVPPEWAFESQYLHSLTTILTNYSLKITNICPFFIPSKKYTLSFEEESSHYRFFYSKDILQFKNNKRITMSFGYSTEEPDLLGLGYFEDNELIAICGAIKNGRYTCDIGVEILDDSYKHQGIATKLVKNLTAKLQELYPTIVPVYSTCLSHTNSMNVAIKSGFQIGWTELLIEN